MPQYPPPTPNELVFWRIITAEHNYTLAELAALKNWADEMERLTVQAKGLKRAA